MFQNLAYFIYIQNPKVVFSFRATLLFLLMNALIYFDIRPGHSLWEKINWHEMNRRKRYGKFGTFFREIKFTEKFRENNNCTFFRILDQCR